MLLLRDVIDAPIFANAEYLSLIEGQGLNPLLQNYWMTIHPPVLFLGFGSMAIPFCYAVAGLWTKQHIEWLLPGFKWALFAGVTLGTGILMGGAWAYEALSFGGYWAWDPVENTSLVPWIILVAGIHTNLISRKTGYSIKSTYLFYILAFLLTLYSTFLTRSGILGDTSAHAFTEMGLEWQLVAFILFFTGLGFGLYAFRQKGVPAPKKEESIQSKEFWMFIGAIVLFFSALLIITSTSLPVFNSIVQYFDPVYEGKVIEDPISHYNKYQLWIAIFIGFLTGMSQFLRFKAFNWTHHKKSFFINTGLSLVIAVGITLLFNTWFKLNHWALFLLLISGLYAIIGNGIYLVRFIKGNLKAAGSVFSHVGFGILILGILSTGLKTSYITSDPFGQRGLVEDDQLANNVALLMGKPLFVNDYWITYEKDTVVQRERLYKIRFEQKDEEGNIEESFTVYPNFLYDKDFTKAAAYNPDTKHYLDRDIFTILAALPTSVTDIEAAKSLEDSLVYNQFSLEVGDTLSLEGAEIVMQEITLNPVSTELEHNGYDLAAGVSIKVVDPEDQEIIEALPILALKDGLLYHYPAKIQDLGLRIRMSENTFDDIFTLEDELQYQGFSLVEGQQKNVDDLTIKMAGLNRNPQHRNYERREGDIAVSAKLEIIRDGIEYLSEPVFIIRGNNLFNIKDYNPSLGMHIRFINIDPNSGELLFNYAYDKRGSSKITFDIAENVPRTDFIYLEARVFPWINLVWLGSILMLLGLLFGFLRRYSQKPIKS